MNQTDLAKQMKEGMRHLASGVAIVATRDNDNNPFAMTVSSITSLTDTPPSLLICLHEVAQTYAVLRQVNSFSANILTQEQQDVSQCCAGEPQMARRFEVGNWGDHPELRLPYLKDSLSVFFCKVSQRIDYGTHMIVIGDIQSVQVAKAEQKPLVYCRGSYCRLA